MPDEEIGLRGAWALDLSKFPAIYELLPLRSFEYSWQTILEIIKILAAISDA